MRKTFGQTLVVLDNQGKNALRCIALLIGIFPIQKFKKHVSKSWNGVTKLIQFVV
jgi:hypothetical protein